MSECVLIHCRLHLYIYAHIPGEVGEDVRGRTLIRCYSPPHQLICILGEAGEDILGCVLILCNISPHKRVFVPR